MSDEPPVSPLEQAASNAPCLHESTFTTQRYVVLYKEERRVYVVAACSECSSYEVVQIF
ncbi:hypothetical protein J4219_08035 [Candidatus Woesearchaeota archaeon]|nr:hypothetical protein [Candidatus Woesearchaeota archaeon]